MPLTRLQLNEAMIAACDHARTWMGSTSPNPCVGAVALDSLGRIIAKAAHHRAGEAHAEALLLDECEKIGALGNIETLCVTLEPCNHIGRTPPCTDRILATGIKSVAIGTSDPNPHVTGCGIDRLRSAGVQIIEQVEEDRCKALAHGFLYRVAHQRPWLTIKRVFDPSGSMLPPAGQKTFSSPPSLRLAHRLRKKADAILTGSGTILADAPLFTVRHVDDVPSKQRFLAILDRRSRVPESYFEACRARALTPLRFSRIEDAMEELNYRGVTDILGEAGPTLAQALIDRTEWAMTLDIKTGLTDEVRMSFGTSAKSVINTATVQLKDLLPS